jgi:Tfp pilus assembly protein PilP
VNPSTQKEAQLIETLQKIKYVGYLQQDKRIWGLVIALDGKVQVVEVGGVIGQIGQILRLSESQLEIQLPRHTLLTIPLSHE